VTLEKFKTPTGATVAQQLSLCPLGKTLHPNCLLAEKYCRKHHTDLVTIRDDSENQKVNALVPVGTAVWIGLYRTTWGWADKSNSSFRNWKSGEPNNVREKNCAAVGESGTWEDDNCAVEKPFICNQGKRVRVVMFKM
uniref:C-type lectin domain-containing protein n=1 Tax=Fundulus heteroclitus TaxID=8078 RepID=A0A3Q2NQE1_FUNHE